MERKVITLDQFIVSEQNKHPQATGDLTRILRDIAIAGKIVNRSVNKAGLVDILGVEGITNIHGEDVKKLDVYANDQFIAALKSGGDCCVIATEENEEIIPIHDPLTKPGKYVVLIDPLDGSSNIDVNVNIGTIFSIYKRASLTGPGVVEDCLQPGNKQVAAGYIIYGSSTMIVYTTGNGEGVNGFTLDPSIGEFCLSHPNMTIPVDGTIYSVNEGNYRKFPEGIKKYIKYCQEEDKTTKRPYTSRYIGSLIADFHRNLIKGGVFIYPPTLDYPSGKLRLIYECNPLALIVKEARGLAMSNIDTNILDIGPKSIHERSSLIIGSENMVLKIMEFLKNN